MKKENINLLSIIKVLKKHYPEPVCALHYTTPIQFLVAVILSAQCTDKRVNEVTKELFKKYKTVGDFANAVPEKFEGEIFSTGFYRAKTKNIIAGAQAIQNTFAGKIPKTMAELITIPGVGRKTANVVLGELYGTAEGIAVDTHVIRLSRLFGLTKHTDATRIEQDLMHIVPQKDWVNFSHRLILYGREYCTAHCKHTDCPLAQFANQHEKSSMERGK